ncbi:DUF3298 and DUF4163 domain-containing protein [Candidatus Cryosericum odellii]|jgi:hypothetical protein|uniref:DUF3298 domain-containing protein n=2 Tax=Candidatus Cryosericum odellii TaxID=2290917 RepID=A0A398DEY7_9BACT|nr:DUF3298 and DUF4163 domain-containing protein [Candidatus Cryosericum odellii]RIE10858.1 DUF3298 domain-containing protein [Candidatus Cryosericum odellii]
MRLKRAVAIVLTAGVVVACAGCRPKAVSIPVNGLPSIVVETMHEEGETLRYSIRAGYPQFRSTLPAGALEKVNKAISTMVLPDIAGLKQNAADDAAWAAKNPSEAGQLPVDQSSFLNTEYEIPYLTNDLVSVRIRFETYSAGAAHGMSFTYVLNARLSDGEILDTEGLFLDGKQGLQWLSQYCVTDLKSQYGADYKALSSFVEYGTAPVADNFKSVSLEPGGLVISFDPYQVGPYAAGPQEVHIPAKDVQPMLAITLSPDAFSLVLGPGD